MGLFSSRRTNTSTTSTTNNLYDQRSVNDAGGGVIGSGNYLDSSSQTSFSDDDQSFVDSSNRSSTVINAIDPGAVQFAQRTAELNASLLGRVAESGNDSARLLGSMALSTARGLGESAGADARSLGTFALSTAGNLGGQVTDLYRTAGQNTATSWAATIGASERLTNRLLDAAQNTTATAGGVARAAISSFQPSENKAQDTALKLGMIAAAMAALFFLMRKG